MRKQGRRDLGSDSDTGAAGFTACGPFPMETLCPSAQRQLNMLSPCSPSWVSLFSWGYGVGQSKLGALHSSSCLPFVGQLPYKGGYPWGSLIPSFPANHRPPRESFLIPFGPVANLTATQVTGRPNLPPTLRTRGPSPLYRPAAHQSPCSSAETSQTPHLKQ